MKTVLITGASGLLGRSLVKAFQTASWKVIGLAHTRISGDLLQVDLTDTDQTAKILRENKPDVVVHSAAQRFPDKVEKDYESAYAINVTASKNLAALSEAEGAAFIFISTDYVFDGQNPPFSESAKPNPLNKYGVTKAEAEEAVSVRESRRNRSARARAVRRGGIRRRECRVGVVPAAQRRLEAGEGVRLRDPLPVAHARRCLHRRPARRPEASGPSREGRVPLVRPGAADQVRHGAGHREGARAERGSPASGP
ncbi:methionine adenosyltransferase 2 subunit beta-like isoform X2 [Haemaphysalis longicornis]